MSQSSVAGRWLATVAVSGLVLLLDQGSKWAALTLLSPGNPLDIVGRFVRFNLVLNPGIAFGLTLKTGMIALIVLALLALCLELFFLSRKNTQPAILNAFSSSRPSPTAVGLIVGGAVGNIIDRIRFGAVVDFIDIGFWPVFNVADIALTAAAILMVIFLWHGSQGSRFRGSPFRG